MLEESIFINEDSLKDFMKKNYGIQVIQIKKITRGSANIYSLNNDKYILKEYQSKYDESSIKKEVTILNHLNDKKMPVPKLIKNKKNELYTKHKNRIVLVEEFIKGEVRGNNTGNLPELIDSAQVLGKIVLALEDLQIDLPISNVKEWFSKEKIEKSILKYEELIKTVPLNEYSTKIKEDLQSKIQMLATFKKEIPVDDLDKLTIKNTHGDYNVQQFIYEANKIKSVIDFAAATKMSIAWELIRSYSYIDKKAKNAEFNLKNFRIYIQEFCRYIPLNNYDIKYMPYLYLMQILHSDYGYKQYIRDTSKTELLEFGFFRTKLCKYLFENAENIIKSFNQI